MDGETESETPKQETAEIVIAERGNEPGESTPENKPEGTQSWQGEPEIRKLTEQIHKLEQKSETTDQELSRLKAELAEKKKRFFRKAKSKRKRNRS